MVHGQVQLPQMFKRGYTMAMTLAKVATILTILTGGIGVSVAGIAYSPFMFKWEHHDDFVLIGAAVVDNLYLRLYEKEDVLYEAQRDAERQRNVGGRVKETTKNRIITLKQSIKLLDKKIKKLEEEIDNE